LGEAAERWLSEAAAGVVRTRSGERYKPSALRSYEQALRARILPRFGTKRLSALSRAMLQGLVDELVGEGCAPSTVRNAMLPLRAIYRRALQRDELTSNPTLKLALPAVRERRERVARPSDAEALLAALPIDQRALWATSSTPPARGSRLRGHWRHRTVPRRRSRSRSRLSPSSSGSAQRGWCARRGSS
jgi:integrase